MASVTSLGVGSGLDLEGMLTKLMQVEQQPLTLLQKKQTAYQTKISALGTLQSALSTLQTAAAALTPSSTQTASEKFASYSASVADSTIASASATSGAVSGTYSLEVSALASAQRLITSASAFGITATASSTLNIDAGTLKIEFGKLTPATTTPTVAPASYVPDATRELDITIAAGASLNDIRDAINAKNGGVSATIVTGTNGPQLTLTSLKEGTDNVMRFSGLTGSDAGNFSFDPLAPATGTLSETAAGGHSASNAAFLLNGIAGTSSTNVVTGMLDGVTINLTKVTAGTAGTSSSVPTSITVSQNTTSGLTSALQAFVKAYNDANTTMGGLGTYNSTTKIAGALQGDSSLRTAQSQVRSLLFGVVAGGSSAYQRLSDIGVSVAKDGSLSLDTTKLSAATSKDFTGVANLVAKVGDSYNKMLDGIVGTTGSLVSATTAVTRMIKDLSGRQTALSDRLTQIEASYRKQFTALDTLVASMNKTSTYLTQQLAALTKTTSS